MSFIITISLVDNKILSVGGLIVGDAPIVGGFQLSEGSALNGVGALEDTVVVAADVVYLASVGFKGVAWIVQSLNVAVLSFSNVLGQLGWEIGNLWRWEQATNRYSLHPFEVCIRQ